MLPFTHDQFIGVFATYNAAVWPAQPIAYLVGLAACVAAWRPREVPAWVAAAAMAAMWTWTGAAYHLGAFARINGAATAFGVVFIAQGLLFVAAAARGRLRFPPAGSQRMRAAAGWGLVGYAMLLYPLLGSLQGMAYPATPTFGITPCPVTLFTAGMLLLADRPPWWLAPIPLAWSLVGASAATLLRVPQDWALLASAAAVLALWVPRLKARPG